MRNYIYNQNQDATAELKIKEEVDMCHSKE